MWCSGFPLPLGPCLAVIALSAWLNVFLSLRWRSSLRLHDRYATLLLGYDIFSLQGCSISPAGSKTRSASCSWCR
jgi:two-component system, sensor histidine kinase RegB